MKPAQSFRDLRVWQRAHALALSVYGFSREFPKTEIYGLSVQIRRAAVSVPANIAEGFRRRGKLEKVRFMNIAEGSLDEVRYYLILAKDLEYGDGQAVMELVEEVSRLLTRYCAAIRDSASDS
jgi:four helix bundle protein